MFLYPTLSPFTPYHTSNSYHALIPNSYHTRIFVDVIFFWKSFFLSPPTRDIPSSSLHLLTHPWSLNLKVTLSRNIFQIPHPAPGISCPLGPVLPIRGPYHNSHFSTEKYHVFGILSEAFSSFRDSWGRVWAILFCLWLAHMSGSMHGPQWCFIHIPWRN